MAVRHACAKCGCESFTLEGPKTTIAGHSVNTGIKLATCLMCGSQDRPKEVEDMIEKDAKKQYKLDALNREMERRRIEEQRYACQPYQLLLAEWLKEFNKKIGANHESGNRIDYYSRGV